VDYTPFMNLYSAFHCPFPEAFPAIPEKKILFLIWKKHGSTFPRQNHCESKVLTFYCEVNLQATASGRYKMLK